MLLFDTKIPFAAATDLALEVNGLNEGGKVSLGKSASWKTVVVKLQLRAGINTVSLSSDNVDWSKVTLDSLTVKTALTKHTVEQRFHISAMKLRMRQQTER